MRLDRAACVDAAGISPERERERDRRRDSPALEGSRVNPPEEEVNTLLTKVERLTKKQD